jgi:dTDP-4-amino-4,6-dideoxygalactose transaminase
MPNPTREMPQIPFNRPHLTGRELSNIAEAHLNAKLAGDGVFTRRCQRWLEEFSPTSKALLTHSCTAALEMAAILCDIGPGDEVILPSYTFVSTANAFVIRGAKPVFVDIRPDTLNIDERLIEAAITPRTRAIVPVHYAGVACEMDRIMEIAEAHGLYVIEDAAQGCMSRYKGRTLGTIGHLGCYSFHETKNIISGEGGALMVNHPALVARAEIIREKGTDRSRFLRGEVDKYTWVDIGSSYLPGEIIAAFLWAQMQCAEEITGRRLAVWSRYDAAFRDASWAQTPSIPAECHHNGHLYYLLNRSGRPRDEVIASLRARGVHTPFHYVPLHSSPFGRKCNGQVANLPVTDRAAAELIRLPLYIDLTRDEQDVVIDAVASVLAPKLAKRRPAAPRVVPIAPRRAAAPALARLAP